MINTPPSPSCRTADCSPPTASDASPRRATAPLPRHGPLEPLRQARPPDIREASTSRPRADLPAELICRIAERMAPADAANYAQVDKATNQALAEPLALRRSQQRDHQRQLVAQVGQAATPEALLAVVQQIAALAGLLRAEPLTAAGSRLSQVTRTPTGEATAAVFRAVWQATISLPAHQRPGPLFAIARQVAVLPAPERLAAMEDALAQMRPFRRSPAHHATLNDWIRRLLPKLPTGRHRSDGLRLLVDEARQLPVPARRNVVQWLERFEWVLGLSSRDRQEVRDAMRDLRVDPRVPVVFRFPTAASTSAPRPASSPPPPP